ncbi:MAG: DUF2442 domain-containing protein [Elusimicrobiota bacterium]
MDDPKLPPPKACATYLRFDKTMMIVSLSDRREIRVPLDWFPRLAAAREPELKKWRLLDKGARIHFSELAEDIWLSALLKP